MNHIIEKIREEFAPFYWGELRNEIEVNVGQSSYKQIYIEVKHVSGVRIFNILSPLFTGVEVSRHFENARGISSTMRFNEVERRALQLLDKGFEERLSSLSIFEEIMLENKKIKQTTLI